MDQLWSSHYDTATHHSCLQSLRSWSTEIICCVVAIAALSGNYFYHFGQSFYWLVLFAGIIAVLTLFDGKLQPEFSLGVTLNVLIEFITSIAKFSFMISIVSSLGQLKWLWFKADAQPLTDFQLHEDATGGGLGSLRLLFSLKVLVKLLVAILYYLPGGMLNTL